jgi:hypothetical protein
MNGLTDTDFTDTYKMKMLKLKKYKANLLLLKPSLNDYKMAPREKMVFYKENY